MIKKTLEYLLSLYNEDEKVQQPEPEKPEPVRDKERDLRDLLRENLALVALDIYYIDDPLIGVPPDKRLEYLKKFWDMCADPEIMEWFKYLINKQVRITMQMSKDGITDPAGAMNINGIATVKDIFEKLANTYVKENVPEKDFNKYNVI